ncbi:MAG: hypothetical protein GXP25_23625 [Planctomycetes bacterium]|nr:hypothetical protein [Planctomycetota bacterium]
MRKMLVGIGLLAFFLGCKEQNPQQGSRGDKAAPLDIKDREYVCRVTKVPPMVDGDLTDVCWAKAQASPVFFTLGPCPERAPERMRIRFLCDDANLYVAVDAHSRPGHVPAAKQERARDDRVFQDDSVELFIHTSPAAKDYYHFMLNCDNAILDAHNDPSLPPEKDVRTQWNPAWKHATKKRSGGWSAEMAIPFKTMAKEPPRQGVVWLVRVGSNASGFPHAMWPKNPTSSFHETACSGYLIFRDRNLLTNGNFEGAVSDKQVPDGWGFAYNDKEGKGVIKLLDTGAPEGKRYVRYEKTTPEKWFPQLWVRPFPIQPHSRYTYSVLVNSKKRFVMRHSLYDAEGKRVKKFSMEQPPTDGYERREITFRIEDNAPLLAVGIQLSQIAGVILVDDVKVERVNGLEFKRTQLPEPHRYHHLEQIAARRPFKPYAQVVEGDRIQSERVIFKDSATGAEIWRITDTPGGATRHFYMEACPWNCDGSRLMLSSSDWGQRFNVLLPPDAGVMQRLPFKSGWFAWDRQDPDRFFYCKSAEGGGSAAVVYSLKDKKETVLRTFKGHAGAWRISEDNKYLLIKEYFPKAPLDQKTKIHLLSLDGKEDIVLDPKGHIHQLWFTKLPDHSVEFEYEHGGYKRGEYPEGNFMMKKNGTITRIYGGEGKWAGHRAHSPSGKLMCPGGRLQIVNKLTGEIRMLGRGRANHQSWEADDSWLAASSGIHLIRFAADGRGFVHRIGSHNSRIGHSTYWAEAHPAMSPDGTKLGYASSMLGDIDFYFIVMMLPGRPAGLTAKTMGRKVQLTWRAPKHAKEIEGYLVYRAKQSGGPFEQIVKTPVSACAFTDTPPGPGPWYYTVSSLERCGLEGLKSNEVCSDPAWPGRVRHTFEAEFAPVTNPPAMEAFDTTASGLYAMNLGRDKPAADFSLPFRVPRKGRYALWLRVKSSDNDFLLTSAIDGHSTATHSGKAGGWRWAKVADSVQLAEGGHTLSLMANIPYVLTDQLVVTDDPKANPSGIEGADTTPPPVPSGLIAEATGRYTVRVQWRPVQCIDFHHYNLYVSESPECRTAQENLVASPSGIPYVDWGRMAGKSYTYRVTAVDRAGNESKPSAATQVSTPPIANRLFVKFDKPWRTKDVKETTIQFDAPIEMDVVVWTKWQSFETKPHGTRGRFDLRIDGKSVGDCLIRFGYICVGHGGPVPGHWLWNFTAPLRGEPGKERFGFRVGKGKHTMTFRVGKGTDLECGGIIVTNDFGFLPSDAYTSFLPMPARGQAGDRPS